MERWRWKRPEFRAAQIIPGRDWPAGVLPAKATCDPSVIACVVIDGLEESIRGGQWVRFDEFGCAVEVLDDADLRAAAISLED